MRIYIYIYVYTYIYIFAYICIWGRAGFFAINSSMGSCLGMSATSGPGDLGHEDHYMALPMILGTAWGLIQEGDSIVYKAGAWLQPLSS